jgi:hypothetical protein
LIAPQVEALKMAYAPAKKETAETIYPGLVPGGEAAKSALSAIQILLIKRVFP